jgi:imidazolonepropionase-like amidohydrolase
VGSESQVAIPAGAQVIDLSQSAVLPGLIDGHSHMFNSGGPKTTREVALLIAVQNALADLRAGFTSARDMGSHSNGYADVDVRNAINEGRFDGPRYQVATRTIGWSASPLSLAAPADPLARAPIHTVEEARAEVREQIKRGADWIKLFPTGDYSFTATGEVKYEMTYPLPVLQALIDETHHLGKKAACHVLGGEGQRNAIIAGCDSIEHGFGLHRDEIDMMAAHGSYYDPPFVCYSEP